MNSSLEDSLVYDDGSNTTETKNSPRVVVITVCLSKKITDDKIAYLELIK